MVLLQLLCRQHKQEFIVTTAAVKGEWRNDVELGPFLREEILHLKNYTLYTVSAVSTVSTISTASTMCTICTVSIVSKVSTFLLFLLFVLFLLFLTFLLFQLFLLFLLFLVNLLFLLFAIWNADPPSFLNFFTETATETLQLHYLTFPCSIYPALHLYNSFLLLFF